MSNGAIEPRWVDDQYHRRRSGRVALVGGKLR
jgi:hypothetical protein